MLLVDLLSQEKKRIEEETKNLRYNIQLVAVRFIAITDWLAQQADTTNLKIGYFGSSTGAATSLIAAARLGLAKAIVTHPGRPYLASENVLRSKP
jgi:dienelactone hydrolase